MPIPALVRARYPVLDIKRNWRREIRRSSVSLKESRPLTPKAAGMKVSYASVNPFESLEV